MAVYHWVWHSFCQAFGKFAICFLRLIHARSCLGRLFKIQAPKIKVAVLAINESIVQNQLEQRQIDFALVTPDFQAPDIHAKNLYDERYICAVRHDHPIAQQIELYP